MKLNIEPRPYQKQIFNSALKRNTLVVLPTGTGKTLIGLMLILHRLKKYYASKVVFLAPTKPLSAQHLKSFEKDVDGKLIFNLLTGETTPNKRVGIWGESDVIFATPQTIRNDLKNGIISLEDVSLLIVDEAHRAVGNYAYVHIAKQYKKQAKHPRILALTASPATEKYKLKSICSVLGITNIESRTERDIKQYIPEKEIENIKVDFPDEMKQVRDEFNKALKILVDDLKKGKYIENKYVSKSKLIQLQKRLQNKLRRYKHPALFRGLFLTATVIKLQHIIQLLESYGPLAVIEYTEKLKESTSKSAKHLLEDPNFSQAISLSERLVKSKTEHPKLTKLKSILKNEIEQDPNSRAIIFSHFRASTKMILNALKELKGIKPVMFIGKSGAEGLKQDEQIKILNRFKKGYYNTLICTSIGEEGIDVPSASLGIFFDTVPSAIRKIQRAGRVGRINFGKLYILITKKTIDERISRIADYKEMKMRKIINDMQKDNSSIKLVDYYEDKN
jgi:Fanconi anemia group M protein